MNHDHIFPQLKSADFVEPYADKLVYTHILPNVICCYVEDMEQTMEYISPERLQELGLSEGELNSIALQNLSDMENSKSGYRIMDHGDGTKSISYETFDSYDATRLLLLFGSKIDFFVEVLGDPFYVAVPCRDFLLAVPASYETKLSAYAKNLYNEKPFPITKDITLFSKNKSTFEGA